MAKLSVEFFKRFIRIVPIEETYFIKKEIPDIKLNKEIIKLNYNALSPFKDGDVLYYKDKHNLYIWFLKNRIDSKKLYIPEGFLIYKEFAEENSILIKKVDDNTFGVVVVKNGFIATQFTKNSITDEFIEILKKEHSIQNAEIKHINEDVTINKTNIKDIFGFADSLDINFKSLALNIYEMLKVPTIVFLILLNVFDLAIYKYITNSVKDKKIELNKLEQSNKAIKDKFTLLEEREKFFKRFIDTELKYPNIYSVLSVITQSIAKNSGSITSYRQSYNIVDIQVTSNSTASLVNTLISTGYFDNVQVINISQSYKDKTKEIGKLELKIKALKK